MIGESSNQKFRPYFTAAELQEIITCLKSHPTPRRLTICQYLEGFVLKINHGIVSPAHTNNPSLEQKLGMVDPNQPIPVSHSLTGEAAYNKWLLSPVSATPKEIAEAMDWRYLNDLMSPDEEAEYERAR
jgi:hypothetical protein